jgi:hypothetical protein
MATPVETHAIFASYDWATFLAACEEMLSTEFYAESYPLLGEYCDAAGCTPALYAAFTRKALDQGLPPQQCLDDLVSMLLGGCRYAREGVAAALGGIQACLALGAAFPLSRLLAPRYAPDEGASLEDEVADYDARAALVDHLHAVVDLASFADWAALEACDWEDLGDDSDRDSSRLRYLKSLSSHLLEAFPNPNDCP